MGRSEEYTWMYVVTAYILIWGSVIIVIWLLLNYVIAAVFRAHHALHAETTRAKAEFALHAKHLTVRLFSRSVCQTKNLLVQTWRNPIICTAGMHVPWIMAWMSLVCYYWIVL